MSPQFFTANRAALREALPDEPIIIVAANGLLQRSADSSFAFQQDSHFWYLTGINEPDVVLIMTQEREYLIVPGRSDSRQAFDGAVNLDDLIAVSGISDIQPEMAGWERLVRLLRTTKRAAMPLPPDSYIEQYGLYSNPSRRRLLQRAKRIVPDLEVTDVRPVMAKLRMVKQLPELTAIQRAIDITAETLSDVTAQINQYAHEYEIEADITRGFRFRGSRGHAFEPIVASGANACTLHNVSNDSPLKKGSLVVMDIGAEVDHYAADITRTVAFGKPSKRQTAVFDSVLYIQTQAKRMMRAGMLLKDYEQAVEQLVGEQLRKLQLITTDDRADIRRYMPHATSHFLGLDVHDVGEYGEPIPADAVLTVEPGIYIPEEGIGVRIEDDVRLTKTGHQVLSASVPAVLQLK